MKKNVIIVIVVAALAILGLVVWMVLSRPSTDSTNSSTTSTSDTASSEQTAVEEEIGEVIVTMKNSSFSPQTLTVKKGTTVKWVNEDTVRHNVVADNKDNAAGLPTENNLFGKDGSYSFTFSEIGTFNYHCTPHPFMKGTITVVE